MTSKSPWMTWIIEESVEAAFLPLPWHREMRAMRRFVRLRHAGQLRTAA